METARLVFGSAQATHDVRGGPARSDDPKRYDALKKLLSIAVVRPEGAMRFSVIGRVRPEDWSALPSGGGPAS